MTHVPHGRNRLHSYTFTRKARLKISRQIEWERGRRREVETFQADRHIPTRRTGRKREKKKECVNIIVVIELKLQWTLRAKLTCTKGTVSIVTSLMSNKCERPSVKTHNWQKRPVLVAFRQGMRESVAVWFYILVIGDFIEGYKACEWEGTEVWYLIREKGEFWK